MKKQDEFEGQKMMVLPINIVHTLQNNEFTNELYITDIGFFPKAKYHFRERKDGCPENILIFCVDGTGWIEVEGKRMTLTKNQYSIIPSKAVHKYAADVNNPWTIYWIHFSGKKADHFVFPLDYPREIVETSNSRFEDRIQLFEAIYYNLESDYSDKSLEYCSVLLMHLLGSLKYLSQFRKIKEIYQKDVVSKAIFYMKENINKGITLCDIAGHCELSVSHFSSLFKKGSSHSPIDYLTILRIQKACSLLDFTSLKIKEIALQLGFNDPYYFIRVFTKHIGISPNNYRKRNGVKFR